MLQIYEFWLKLMRRNASFTFIFQLILFQFILIQIVLLLAVGIFQLGFYNLFLSPSPSFSHRSSLVLWSFLLSNRFLLAFDFGTFLPSSLANIGVCKIKITIELISPRAARLIVFLVVFIIRSIDVTSKVTLVFLPKKILLGFSTNQLFHTSSPFRTELHRLYGGLYHLRRPSRTFLRIIVIIPLCILVGNLFFLLACARCQFTLPPLIYPSLPHLLWIFLVYLHKV